MVGAGHKKITSTETIGLKIDKTFIGGDNLHLAGTVGSFIMPDQFPAEDTHWNEVTNQDILNHLKSSRGMLFGAMVPKCPSWLASEMQVS